MLQQFRMVQRFRVPFADCDMLRHVNNAAYILWAEHIRCEYFIDVLEDDFMGERGMIMAQLEIVYERPIIYRERVAIGCRISRIGNKSFDFVCEIWSEDQEIRCAHLVSRMVAMNYLTDQTIPVPDAWRDRIAAFELPSAGVP
ncbi:MAG: acyl-CoA thioesterase [Vulcanimicrobiaceae bacterium]